MLLTSKRIPSTPSNMMLPLILRSRRSWSAPKIIPRPLIFIPSLPLSFIVFSERMSSGLCSPLVIRLAVAFFMFKRWTPLGRPKLGKMVEKAWTRAPGAAGFWAGSVISKLLTLRNSTRSKPSAISGSLSLWTYWKESLFWNINILILKE